MPKSPTKTSQKPQKGRLNVQQLKFIDAYLRHGIGKRAAVEAGYSAKGADSWASQLLRVPKVAERIEAGLAHKAKLEEAARARAANKIEVTETRWLQEVSALAFTDMDQFVEITPNAVRIIPTEERHVDGRAIAKVSESKGKNGTQRAIQLHNKLGALELIAKHKGFIKDRSEITDPNAKPVRVNITLPGNGREVKPKKPGGAA